MIMLIRLFALPIQFLLGSVASAVLLGWFIPGQFEDKALLAPLATALEGWTWYVSGGLLLLAVLFSILPVWRLWQRQHGEGDLCALCTGIMRHKDGRWGPYLQCLACGHKRKDR